MEYYTEEATSSINNDSESATEIYQEEEVPEDEEYQRYRKEQIFSELDYINKRKTKIACTIG